MNQNFDVFYFSPILVKCVQDEPNKHTMKFQKQASPRYSQLKIAFFGPHLHGVVGKIIREYLTARACDTTVGEVHEIQNHFSIRNDFFCAAITCTSQSKYKVRSSQFPDGPKT